MVNLLEALYALTAACLLATLYHAWRAARADGGGTHRRRLRAWGAATAAGVLVCAALYAYLA
jgi:hypothetical protein